MSQLIIVSEHHVADSVGAFLGAFVAFLTAHTSSVMLRLVIASNFMSSYRWGFLAAKTVKASGYNTGDLDSIPGLNRKILWRRKWQPTPVLLPGKPHGRRSLVGCSPWGYKESDTTE